MRLKIDDEEVSALTNNHHVFWQITIAPKVELVMAARAVLEEREAALKNYEHENKKLHETSKRLKDVLKLFERVEEPDLLGGEEEWKKR